MKSEFFMLSMTLSGIKNIEKELRIEFYKKTVDKDFNPSKFKIKAIYGENGAGKTAIIMAVSILKNIVLTDAYLQQETVQEKLQRLINKKTKKLMISTEFIKRRNEENELVVYKYEVAIGLDETGRFVIEGEDLKRKSGEYTSAKYRPLFECESSGLKNASLDEDTFNLITEQTRNLLQTSSLINICMKNIPINRDLIGMSAFYAGITDTILFMANIFVSMEDSDQHEPFILGEQIRSARENNEYTEIYRKMLMQSELMVKNGRKNVWKKAFKTYKEEVAKLESFLKLFKHDLQGIEIDKRDSGNYYETLLVLNYGDYKIDTEFESNGIKKLIKLFNFLNKAASGNIAFIDEMDSNINDVYLTKLIDFFMEYGEGQLCFTTHNTGPMASLRRNKKAIDFLSSENRIVEWKTNGNFAPDSLYRQGMIEYLPFNVEPEDFVGILGE